MSAAKSKGFTLIELMVVVAVIGILASIAIPAYQEYVARAQASEALELLGGSKVPLAEYYADGGRWPANATLVGINVAGNYVLSAVDLIGANSTSPALTLRATFKSNNVAKVLQNKRMTMSTTDGGQHWDCGPDAAAGVNAVPDRYLPASCR